MPILSLGTGLSVLLLSVTSAQSCSVSQLGTGVADAKAALESTHCPLSQIQDAADRSRHDAWGFLARTEPAWFVRTEIGAG